MRAHYRNALFILLAGAALALAITGFVGGSEAESGRESGAMGSSEAGAGHGGMDMGGLDRDTDSDMDTDTDMDMKMNMTSMASLPELEEGMEDPYLDPYTLKLGGHVHADASSETEEERSIRAEWLWPDGLPAAGETKTLRIRIVDGTGSAIPSFDVNNEKLLHLVIVDRDLGSFQHVHPEFLGEGTFELAVTFPQGGAYKLFADFMPTGLSELTRSLSVEIAGAAPSPAALKADTELTKAVDGMEISLRFDHLMAKMQNIIAFTFKDAESGEPIRDLELYLGSVGHVIALDSTASSYMHVHPYNWGSSGPVAVFGVTFPDSGLYKPWGQFKRDGKVITVPFVVQVP